MHNDDIKILFQRYIRNEYTEADLRLLLSFLNDEKNADLFKELFETYGFKNEKAYFEGEFQARMQSSFNRADAVISDFIASDKRKKSFSFRWMKLTAAAAACLLVVGSYLFFTDGDAGQDGLLPMSALQERDDLTQSYLSFGDEGVVFLDSTTGAKAGLLSAGVTMTQINANDLKLVELNMANLSELSLAEIPIKIKVGLGRDMKLELTDGTVVSLNSGSELSFTRRYGLAERVVTLNGEGYFDVTRDVQKPFIVKTRDQEIKVYGTKFNVKNFNEDDLATTTLVEGKVSVRKITNGVKDKEHMLRPGDQVLLSRHSTEVVFTNLEAEKRALAWTEGKFIYDNTKLADILKDFARWYNVDTMQDSVPELTFTGTIRRDYELEKALEMISKAGNINLKRKGKTIIYEKDTK